MISYVGKESPRMVIITVSRQAAEGGPIISACSCSTSFDSLSRIKLQGMDMSSWLFH